MLRPGDKAPPFRLSSTSDASETKIALSDLKGQKIVLYFYPKDDTPGCTREACDFRDNLARLKRRGVRVLGVSKDSLSSHERFRAKYDLPFDLLSDPDNAVAEAYGAYGEKNMYGRKILGTIRSTFLIDEKGRIAAVWTPVRVNGHVEQVLDQLSGGVAKKTRGARSAGKKK